MKFDFEDGSYLEISKTNNVVYVTVAARTNDRHFIANTADINIEQFKQICVDVLGVIDTPKKQSPAKKSPKKKQVEREDSKDSTPRMGGTNNVVVDEKKENGK